MRHPAQEEPPIDREIRHEKARTLGKAGDALERACAAAWELFRAAGAGDPAYREAHARARERRHALVLQREALGLFRHGDVDRLYPLPPEPDPAPRPPGQAGGATGR